MKLSWQEDGVCNIRDGPPRLVINNPIGMHARDDDARTLGENIWIPQGDHRAGLPTN